MELRHLRYFIIVAEEENVTRAAQRLHISQPPLSKQIQELEAELGVTLFERTGRSLRLNELGKKFLIEARAVIARVEQAVAAVQGANAAKKKIIKVAYAPTLSADVLPQLLRDLAITHPQLSLNLHDLSSEEMREGILNGHLDLAYTAIFPNTVKAPYKSLTLQQHPICVAMCLTHPWVKKRKIPLAEVFSQPLIGYCKEGYGEYHQWLRDVAMQTSSHLVFAQECDSMTSLIAALESSQGVALVPSSLAYYSANRLIFRPVTPSIPPLAVGLLWHANKENKDLQAVITAAQQYSKM
jgi:DNA-binding transcriptional LysR family regulator